MSIILLTFITLHAVGFTEVSTLVITRAAGKILWTFDVVLNDSEKSTKLIHLTVDANNFESAMMPLHLTI